jgi:hypothetical protein
MKWYNYGIPLLLDTSAPLFGQVITEISNTYTQAIFFVRLAAYDVGVSLRTSVSAF